MMDGSQVSVAPVSLAAPPAPTRWRKRVLLGAVAVAVLGGAGTYGYDWWTEGRYFETTDDAYVQADMAVVSSRVPGQVSEVLVADNQMVHRGDVLVRLDDRDLQVSLAQARADVASAEADIHALQAQLRLQSSTIAAAEADVTSADASAAFAKSEFTRYSDLVRSGSGSVQRAQQADADIKGRDAAAARARSALEGAKGQTEVLQAQLGKSQAALLHARASAEQAALNLSYGAIVAPVDGAVGDRSVRPGQYVQPGARLLDVVPMETGLYVVANFKETQLAKMGAGEDVTLSFDMLGGPPFRGVVDSLSPGSGATFALLPPENATGNFTKIVQRVGVRIRLLPDDRLSQLRPGLSVSVAVDGRTAPPGRLQTRAMPPKP